MTYPSIIYFFILLNFIKTKGDKGWSRSSARGGQAPTPYSPLALMARIYG